MEGCGIIMAEIRNKPVKNPETPEIKERNRRYNELVKEKTPTHPLPLNMAKAFLVGGLICTLGQAVMNYCDSIGLEKDIASSWTSLVLVLLSVILTALHLYGPMAKFGGAGALVPITGFANSVASPAVEFKAEGQVYGIGCQIFTIAGPVILYGIFTSWIAGLIYWIIKLFS